MASSSIQTSSVKFLRKGITDPACTAPNREDASIHRVIDRQKSLIPGDKHCLLRCGHCNLWVKDRNFKAVVRWRKYHILCVSSTLLRWTRVRGKMPAFCYVMIAMVEESFTITNHCYVLHFDKYVDACLLLFERLS